MKRDNLNIRFKGNFINKKIISLALCYIAIGFLLFGPLYFMYFRDWSFYFIPLPSLLIMLAYMCLITFLALKIFEKYHLQSQITIKVNPKQIEIFENGVSRYTYHISEINLFAWVQRNLVYEQIHIQSNNELLKINIGSVFKGTTDEDFKQWLTAVTEQLKKQLKAEVLISSNIYTIKRNLKNQQQSVSYKVVKVLSIAILVIVGFIVGTYTLVVYVFGDDDPDNEVSLHGISCGISDYYLYNDQIYFRDQDGNGYFKVKNSDSKTFQPLNKEGQYSTNMGVDTFSVFYEKKQIEGIDRKQVRYIGGYYTADNKNVYYKDIVIEGADSHTFELMSQDKNNSKTFPYGRDKNYGYYQSVRMKDLNPSRAILFDAIDYISDGRYAYYKGEKIEHAQGISFMAEYVDRNLTFAQDSSSFWVNGIKFPENVQNRFIGTTSVDQPSLKLMAKKGEGSAHMIFYDQKHIYYFDEQKQEYYFIKDISNLVLTKITNGVYRLGEDIYLFRSKINRSHHRGGSSTISVETKLAKLDNVKFSSLEAVKEIRDGIIWSDGIDYYFSYNSKSYSKSGLFLINKDLLDINKITYITKDMLKIPSTGRTLFTIKTRPEWQ